MRRLGIPAWILVVAVAVGLAVAPPAGAFDPRCPVATEERAKALAEKAAVFLREKGAATALPAFTKRTHGFGAGDLYVFVFDFKGTMVASGGWPDQVGSTIIGPDGRMPGVYGRLRRMAESKRGRGWIHYSWYSPCTRTMQPKMTYVIRVGGYIVGVGAYKIPGV